MATCKPLSSNDLRVANFRLPSVYSRREHTWTSRWIGVRT
jgi:hypothetical protein